MFQLVARLVRLPIDVCLYLFSWAFGLIASKLAALHTIEIDGVVCEIEYIDGSGRRRITSPDGKVVEVGPTVPDHVIQSMLGTILQPRGYRDPLQQFRDEYPEGYDDEGDEPAVPLSGVTLTNADGSKLKVKEGRDGHCDLEVCVTSGDTLSVSWDGATKLTLNERHLGLRYVQGGEIRIDLTMDTRRPLLLKDGNDAELREHMAAGRAAELKLILGGSVDDDDARDALAPFFPPA